MVQKLLHKKILITGSTGFIGANLARFLVSKGISAHIFIRKDSNLWRISDIKNKLKPHIVDLSDSAKTNDIILRLKPQIIFHCAVYGGYHFQLDRERIMQTNTFGTMNLLNACVKSGFECFINTGSSSEYGLKNRPMRESDLLEPVNDYAIAKATATLFCSAVAKRKKLPIITLRLFSAYGPYEQGHRLIPSVILSCLKKENPKLSLSTSVRDFIFIEDVINAFIKAVEHKDDLLGEVINIGSAKEYSVKEVVSKIINLVSWKTKPLWKKIANPRIEPCRWQADITKAKKMLNWSPLFTLDEGLEKTLRWFNDNIGLYNA